MRPSSLNRPGGPGMAVGFVGFAFLLRVAGDGGEASGIGWLSWLSPIGWFTRLRPFASERLPVMLLFFGLALLFGLPHLRCHPGEMSEPGCSRRDPDRRRGPCFDPRSALGWRIHRLLARMVVWGWLWSEWSMARADSIGDMLEESPQLAAIFEQLGGAAGITDAFFATSMGILALIATAYAIRSVLRLRVEEESLRAEPVLATATPRLRWAGSHLCSRSSARC